MPRQLALIILGAVAVLAPNHPSVAQDGGGCTLVRQVTEGLTDGSRGGGFLTGDVSTGSISVSYQCADIGSPVGATGAGGGGQSRCTPTPIGDIAEVQAIYAAVNAAQTPDPSNTAYVEDVVNPGGPSRIINASWYRINGDSIQILYNIKCVDPPEQYSRWIAVTPDAAGNLVPRVTAADLVPALSARVIRQLPTPVTKVGPADDRPDGFAFVQIRTFFWVDQVPGQWETVSGTASAGGISVTVQAEPVRLVIDPGDGSAAVSCDGAPTAVTSANYSENIEGCHHVYLDSSSMSAKGETFPVTTTIVWHATWSASTGEGGDLGYVSTASAVRDLPVAEVQALITDG